MLLYLVSVYIHIFSAVFFMGYLLFWATMVGPIVKRVDSSLGSRMLGEIRLKFSVLGWASLLVLVMSGTVLLNQRAVTMEQVVSGELFLGPFGQLLGIKLLLVGFTVLYHFFIGHQRARRLIHLNMAVALVIVGLSVLLIRAPKLFDLSWRFGWF